MKITKRDVDDVYRLDFGSGTAPVFLSEEEMDELRGGFQAERDETLGRWRDPKNPDLVCYPVLGNLDAVWVMYEGNGLSCLATRTRWEYSDFPETAGRYFQAHPKPEPRPWEEAKEGEVWVITHEGVEGPAIVSDDGHFESPDYVSGIYNKAITAGYRIWPEGDK